jgi:hypothetical protein
MDAGRFATRVLTRLDPHGGPDRGTVNATLRADALRQLRWRQREWTRILATKDPCRPPSSGTIRLSDTSRLPTVAAKSPPPPDWFDPPTEMTSD